MKSRQKSFEFLKTFHWHVRFLKPFLHYTIKWKEKGTTMHGCVYRISSRTSWEFNQHPCLTYIKESPQFLLATCKNLFLALTSIITNPVSTGPLFLKTPRKCWGYFKMFNNKQFSFESNILEIKYSAGNRKCDDSGEKEYK